MVSVIALVIILSNLSNLSLVRSESYRITPLNITSGIFYHHVGNAKISHDFYTLLSFSNISIYEQKLKLAFQTFQTSLPLCKNFRQRVNESKQLFFTCNRTLELLSNNLNNLNEKFDSLCHLTGHNIDELDLKRQKRGLFDGVSYAIKWLFGTPDAEDAKYYSQAIEAIASQNHDMQVLMKQQVHIISNAIEDYNKTAQALNFNQDKLNTNIIKFNRFANSTTKRINSLTFAQTVTDNLNLLSQLVNELNEEFDTLISAILFAKQNILHPSVITPRHLKNELSKIILTNNLELPYSLDDYNNAYKYIEICSLSMVYINKVLIFAIKIPLVTKDLFQIYNLIPVPSLTTKPNVYSFINPSIPYLLLSATRNYYSELNDLSKCQASPPFQYICPNAIIHLVKERPTCETELKLTHYKTIPVKCETKVIKSEVEIWHPLSNNQWLFIMTRPMVGTINCESNGKITDVTLQGVGIFELQSKCKCYTLSTLLTATSNQTSNHTNFIPSVDITGDDCCIKQQEYLTNEDMEPIKLTNLNLNELRHAESKLQQFDEELKNRINQPFFVYKTKWYNTLLGVLATIIVIFLFCWCCCKKCRWPLLNWFKRLFCKQGCASLVCINSHNTVSNSSIASYVEPSTRPTRRPPIAAPRDSMSENDIYHHYEEPIELPVRPNTRKNTFKI